MTNAVASDFRSVIAHRLEAAHQLVASRWFDRLQRLIPVAPDEIFPGEPLLGHLPQLILELAAFFRAPAAEAIAANALVTTKATELGRLRHAQGASVHQLLREYRELRLVVAQFIEEETVRLGLQPGVDDVFELSTRLDAAIDMLVQTSVDAFIAHYTQAITEHTARLEQFNRMVSHELRQPLSTLQMAITLLAAAETRVDRSERDRILATAERNVTRLNETLGKLVALSRAPDTDTALVQRVELSVMIDDIIGQLREMADVRDVEIRVSRPLPAITADVARLEIVLLNLVSNAIKYSDRDKTDRFVEVSATESDRPDTCTLRIHDNGQGIAEPELQAIFGRFYRGHAGRNRRSATSGMGLGLSIVADCVEALHGSIRVESTPGAGTTFLLELPLQAGA
jgi:signal transduction histidine kinase